ncbi:MAG: type IX secretion system membrane protein PorP/SprF [Bacteroidia bacterium]|nr:type IX secretion system membrane protein PorP/SprF [Bacteroidia bacterium]
MKKLILFFAMSLVAFTMNAQQDPQFSHYMYNTISVNPAYAGSRGVLNITGLHRSQWIGLEGAPTSQTLTLNTPLRNRKMGVGLSVVNDKIGPLNQTFIYGDYSYTVRLTEKLKLAFGLKAGINWFQPKISSLNTIQNNDPSFVGSTMESVIKPNIGAGIYLHRDDWYIGASSPRLVQNKFNLGGSANDTTSVLEERHMFFIAGYLWTVNPQLKLKPTAQLKMVQDAPMSIDATLEALIRNKFSIGAGLRVGDSFYGMLGYQFTDQFRVGFAYDYTTTRLQNVNNGTVEFMLSYDFYFNNDKLKSPRYF